MPNKAKPAESRRSAGLAFFIFGVQLIVSDDHREEGLSFRSFVDEGSTTLR